MRMRSFVGMALAASSALVFGCGGAPSNEAANSAAPAAGAAAPAAGASTADAASHEGHTGGRVFFASPKDGAMVKSPVQFEFGSDMFTIAAVPKGDITDVRSGTGHFHLGTDTDCLPVATVIPKANPWVHFGDGKNVIEMQLAPGPHKMSVQAGDDKHQTMTGLCETITITVTE
jgi:hypothetical protein